MWMNADFYVWLSLLIVGINVYMVMLRITIKSFSLFLISAKNKCDQMIQCTRLQVSESSEIRYCGFGDYVIRIWRQRNTWFHINCFKRFSFVGTKFLVSFTGALSNVFFPVVFERKLHSRNQCKKHVDYFKSSFSSSHGFIRLNGCTHCTEIKVGTYLSNPFAFWFIYYIYSRYFCRNTI